MTNCKYCGKELKGRVSKKRIACNKNHYYLYNQMKRRLVANEQDITSLMDVAKDTLQSAPVYENFVFDLRYLTKYYDKISIPPIIPDKIIEEKELEYYETLPVPKHKFTLDTYGETNVILEKYYDSKFVAPETKTVEIPVPEAPVEVTQRSPEIIPLDLLEGLSTCQKNTVKNLVSTHKMSPMGFTVETKLGNIYYMGQLIAIGVL